MNLLNQFKEYLFSQDDAPAQVTVKNYISDVNHFIKWFESYSNLPFAPNQITDKDIAAYQELNKAELSAVSIQRHLSSLRKFFQFLKLEGQIIISPFELAVSSQKLEVDPWKLKDFKNHLYENNSAHLTIKNYIIDVKQFITWAKEVTGIEDDLLVNRIDKNFIEEYKLRLLEKSGYSPSTINRKLSSLRSYASWANQQGLLTQNIISVENVTKAKQKLYIPSPAELEIRNSKLEIPNKSYSRFPPLRLFQKITRASTLAFDSMLIAPLAGATLKLQNFSWKLKGQPIFTKGPQSLITKNITPQDLLGIKNISKKFYAPFNISTKSFSPLQKLIFHTRYTRPKWYKAYHSYAITHYFHFAVLIIFLAALGFGLFNAFFVRPSNQNPALAALPTAPPRVLSFQGRLTDNNDNPITANTNVRYAIYNDITASGAALLWQEVDPVTPDTDGIFNSILGNVSSIPSTLFSENAALYLGVTIEATPELTPRQQLATVAYATNSETLQGLPPSTAVGAATSNVVLALDSSGNLTIGGSANPVFSATGGTFKLSGQPLLLTTNVGSNSNVNITTDGLGRIDLQKPLQNTSNSNNITTALGSVEVDDLFSILATSSGQSALTINQNSTGPLISASTSGTAKFTVDNSGNETLAGNSTIAGTTGITFSSTGGINLAGGTLSDSTDGVDIADALEVSGLITANGGLTVASGQTTTLASFTSNGGVLYTNGSGVVAQATAGTSSDCLIGGTTPSFSSCAGAASSSIYWNQSNGALYPKNSTVDLLIGGQATTSALFSFTGVSNLNNQTKASISGQLIVMPNNGFGNVGIGTTTPVGILDVSGTTETNIRRDTSATVTVAGNLRLHLTSTGTVGNGFGNALLFNLEDAAGTDVANTGYIASVWEDAAAINQKAGLAFYTKPVGGSATEKLRIDGAGNVGIGTTTPTSELHVTRPLSFGATGKALAIFDQIENQDIFTASASGTPIFTVTRAGGIALGTNGLTVGNSSQCIVGGTTATWASCASAASNYWQLNLGALSPFSNTADILIGGTSTASAKFAFTGLSSLTNQTQASISGQLIVMPNNGFGNVGIGDTSPLAALTVGNGDLFQVNSSGAIAAATGITSSGTITLSTFTSNGGPLYTNGSGVLAQTTAGSTSQCLLGGTTPAFGSCASGETQLWQQSLGALYPNNSTVDLLVGGQSTTSAKFAFTGMSSLTNQTQASFSGQLIVMPNNGYSGKVGIGTTTPSEVLTVSSTTDPTLEINPGTNTTVDPTFRLADTVSTAGFEIVYDNDVGSTYFKSLYNNAAGDIYFQTKTAGTAVDALFIESAGNIGIGTTTPSQKLELASGSNFAVDLAPVTTVRAVAYWDPDSTLAANTYYFKIVAVDGVGLSLPSSEVTCTVDGATTNACSLNWTAVVGAQTYRVYKGTAAGGEDRYIPSLINNTTANYFTDTGATLGAAPTTVTAFVNKITASGDSWFAGGQVGIGFAAPTSWLHIAPPKTASVSAATGTAGTGTMTLTGQVGGDTFITTTGTGGAGGAVSLTTGAGGTASAALVAATGGAGGTFTLGGGVGGLANIDGTGNNTGGAGGAFTWTAGTGGAATGDTTGNNTGGTGGAITLIGGTGGAASNANGTPGTVIGQNGGAVTVRAGTGGVGIDKGGTGGLLTLSGGIAAAVQNATGGAVTVSAGVGSAVGTGGAGGALTMSGGAAGGDNTFNRAGGAVSITAGLSKGPTQAGGALTLTAGAGGQNLNTGTTTGPNGGAMTFTLGAGGTAPNADTTSTTGGNGGLFTFTGGAGGAGSSTTVNNIGGVGSAFSWISGAGGAANGANSLTNTGGNGGAITIRPGTGGAATLGSTNIGGNGGLLTLQGGTAGTGGTGGTGGGVTVQGGSGAATGGTGGTLTLAGGVGGTSGVGASIVFNTAATTSLATRMTITNAGNVGIGTTTPTAMLDVAGDASTSGSLVFNGSNKSIDILNGSRLDFQTSTGGDAGLTNRMTLDNYGRLGIGTSSPTSELYVTRPLSFGATGKALAIFDQIENQDIFTASASGVAKFSITYAGGIKLATSEGSSGECVKSGGAGAAATFGTCGAGGGSNWTLGAGFLTPNNSTVDLLIGGQATTSAKFAFTGLSSLTNQTQASISGQLVIVPNNGYGGNITTVNNLPLTISPHGSGILHLNNSGTGATNIGNGTNTGAVSIGNTTGDITLGADTITASSLATITSAAGLGVSATTLTLGNGSAATLATTTNGLTLDSGSNTLTIAASDTTLTASGITTVTLGTSATINAGATALNLQADGTPDVNIAGGSGTTGCTILNATGNLSCSGIITSTATTGIQGWWNQTGGTLFPTNSTVDFLFGAQATTSATFHLYGAAPFQGTQPVASIAAHTSFAGLVIDNNKTGDLLTASNSGVTRFVVKGQGNVGIGHSNPISQLYVTRPLLAGATGKALAIFDQIENQDIFAASNSGTTRFSLGVYGNATQSAMVTTMNGYNLNANTLTSGYGMAISSTSTGLTSGGLLNLDWSPGSATTATGDLLSLNIGANGILGNIFNVKDNGSSVFSVSQTAVTANLPASFNAAGDVSIAYDINFTNPTASYIKSAAPLYITAGETFNSSDLNLTTYNKGNVVVNTEAMSVIGSATVSANLTVGTVTGNKILPGVDNLISIGATSTARFKDLFLGPSSLHVQCTTGDGCAQATDYAMGVNTANGRLNINVNNTTQLSLYNGGRLETRSFYDLDNTAYFIDPAGGTSAVLSGSVGIGDTSPDYTLELSGATAPKFALSDTDMAHGVTTFAETDSYFMIDEGNADDGRARIWGFSDAVGVSGMSILGIIGSTDPTDTVPGIKLYGGKKSGTTVADMGALETVLQIGGPGTDATYLTVLGSGNVGIGTTTPAVPLEVRKDGNGAAWYSRVSASNSTSDKQTFLGTYASVAGVFSHNFALNAWADLYVNTVDGSTGGMVRMPTLAINSSTVPSSNTNLSVGNTGVDYPANSGWASTFNTNILINSLDTGTISFHDAGSTVGTLGHVVNSFFFDGSSSWGPVSLGINTRSPASYLGGAIGLAISSTLPGLALYRTSDGTDWVMYAYSGLISWYDGSDEEFEIDANGNVYADGAYTGPADYAEYFETNDPSIDKGELVSLDPENSKFIKKATINDPNILGIVSTKPGVVGVDGVNDITADNKERQNNPRWKIIGLLGQVPTKVSTENGAILIGDYLTGSSTPGVAMKATKAGRVVARALEPYNGSGVEKISSYVSATWYDPDVYITTTGDLNVVQNNPDNFVVIKPNNETVNRIAAFSEAVIGNIRAGAINAQQITTNSLTALAANFSQLTTDTLAVTTDGVTIAGQSLKDYIASVVNDVLQTTNYSLLTTNIISPLASIDEIHTNVISPLAQNPDSKLAIKLNDVSGNSKLEIRNSSNSAVATFDSAGNASFSGQLSASSVQSSDASISGTLRARRIIADQIEGLNIQTATLSANYITNNYYSATQSAFPTLPVGNPNASGSGNLSNLFAENSYINIASYSSQFAYVDNLSAGVGTFSQGLMVFGSTTLSDTSIVGQLAISGNLILADKSINVLGGDLSLQPLRQGGLSIMAGLIYIDTNGNVKFGSDATFEKNVTIKGRLATNTISPIGSDLTINLASNSASKLAVNGASGSGVLTIDNLGNLIASGAASISKLNINNIVSPALAFGNDVNATGSAGTVTLRANKSEVTVNNKLVTENSLIYITPVGSTLGQNLYLVRQVPDASFTVGISVPVPNDTKFNFLIIN